MKRFLFFIFMFGVWNVLAPHVSAAMYSGGIGTITYPYRINSIADWQTFMTATSDWNKYFVLMNDIDLQGIVLTPVGNLNVKFTGFFNGNHHIIRNAAINTSAADYVGLFGYNTGRISNLRLESLTMTGNQYVGGLVGANARSGTTSGTVTGCYSTGDVTGSSESKHVGGLIGSNAGVISHCRSACTVSNGSNSDVTGGLVGSNGGGTITACCSTGPVSGYMGVGGLAGVNAPVTIWTYQGWIIYPAVITESYSSSQVSGFRFVGGFTGNNSGAITNCYSTGLVIGSFYAGGLVGDSPGGLVGTGSVVGSYWDTQTSGQTSSSGGTGKTSTEMQTLATFTNTGWDFTNETANGMADFWRLCTEGVDYPRLNWESIRGDFVCPDGVNTEDLDIYIDHWFLQDCSAIDNFCDGADMNFSGRVDLADFALLADHWLEGFSIKCPNWSGMKDRFLFI